VVEKYVVIGLLPNNYNKSYFKYKRKVVSE